MTKKYFDWYKNLNFFLIKDVSKFVLVNESTILTEITLFFSYSIEGAPEIVESLDQNSTFKASISGVKIDKGTFMKSFEFLLSPCHWYEVKIFDVGYFY